MKINILKEKLEKVLEKLDRVSGKGTNLPILSYALIEEENGLLKCSATNLDLGITTRLSAKIEESGSECVPIKQLKDFLQYLPSGQCTVEVKEKFLFIYGGNSEGKIPVLPKDEFPIIPIISTPLSFSADAASLRKGFELVLPAVAKGQARVEFTGILLSASKDGLVLAATDSFRLAEKTFLPQIFSEPPREQISCILPPFLVQEFVQNAQDGQRVECFVSEHQILFRFPEVEIISRIIQGSFPNYREVIPTSHLLVVELERPLLMNTVSLAGLFSGRSQEVTFDFNLKDKKLIVHGEDSQKGEGSSSLPMRLVSGAQSCSLRFNLRYVLDALRVAPASRITLSFSNEERPLVIRSHDDPLFFFLIMPIRSSA